MSWSLGRDSLCCYDRQIWQCPEAEDRLTRAAMAHTVGGQELFDFITAQSIPFSLLRLISTCSPSPHHFWFSRILSVHTCYYACFFPHSYSCFLFFFLLSSPSLSFTLRKYIAISNRKDIYFITIDFYFK